MFRAPASARHCHFLLSKWRFSGPLGAPRYLTIASDSQEEKALLDFRDAVRSFAESVVAPRAREIDKSNAFPTDVNLWKEMGSMGLHGITVPEEHGGLGLGYLHHWWVGATFRILVGKLRIRDGSSALKAKEIYKNTFIRLLFFCFSLFFRRWWWV